MGREQYRVKAGDTLSSISRRHATTVEALSLKNGLKDVDRISIGQVLLIPSDETTPPRPRSTTKHRVFAGETLFKIARQYKTTVESIAHLNKIPNVNKLHIGQTLEIPAPDEHHQTQSKQAPDEIPRDGELILIDGQNHLLRTRHGTVSIEDWPESKAATPLSLPSTSRPHFWLITRDNGFPLFALRLDAEEDAFEPDFSMLNGLFDQHRSTRFRVLTAKQLYARGIQWFEPLANNYRELIWIYAGSETTGSSAYPAYKHFSWKDIVDFSIVDRRFYAYRSGGAGDWKQSPAGGNGFLLVLIEGYPYWGDAVGQIPFAVDTYKDNFERTGDKEESILETIKTGLAHGDGSILPSKEDDPNKYDNFMVLRGALWASENHTAMKKVEKHLFGTFESTSFEVRYDFKNPLSLSTPVSEALLSKYGVWRK